MANACIPHQYCAAVYLISIPPPSQPDANVGGEGPHACLLLSLHPSIHLIPPDPPPNLDPAHPIPGQPTSRHPIRLDPELISCTIAPHIKPYTTSYHTIAHFPTHGMSRAISRRDLSAPLCGMGEGADSRSRDNTMCLVVCLCLCVCACSRMHKQAPGMLY